MLFFLAVIVSFDATASAGLLLTSIPFPSILLFNAVNRTTMASMVNMTSKRCCIQYVGKFGSDAQLVAIYQHKICSHSVEKLMGYLLLHSRHNLPWNTWSKLYDGARYWEQ